MNQMTLPTIQMMRRNYDPRKSELWLRSRPRSWLKGVPFRRRVFNAHHFNLSLSALFKFLTLLCLSSSLFVLNVKQINMPISALPVDNMDTGPTRVLPLHSTGPFVPAPLQIQAPATMHPKHLAALHRIEEDEYTFDINFSCNDNESDEMLLNTSYAEYLEGSDLVIVKGRLKGSYAFWERIGAPSFILDTISSGYKIPFYHTPPSIILANNKSALRYPAFVSKAISELVYLGSVIECDCPPFVVNPLSVAIQSSGKKRLILDLRHVNVFVKKSKIKFEDANSMLTVLLQRTCSWAFSFDIISGYHHIEIYEPD
jgi:hypothetical protein